MFRTITERLPASWFGAAATPVVVDPDGIPEPTFRERLSANVEFFQEEAQETYRSVREGVQFARAHPMQAAGSIFRNTAGLFFNAVPQDLDDEVDVEEYLQQPVPTLREVASEVRTNLFVDMPAETAPDGTILHPPVPSTVTLARQTANAAYQSRPVQAVVQSAPVQAVTHPIATASAVYHSERVQTIVQSRTVQSIVQSAPAQAALHPIQSATTLAASPAGQRVIANTTEMTRTVRRVAYDYALAPTGNAAAFIYRRAVVPAASATMTNVVAPAATAAWRNVGAPTSQAVLDRVIAPVANAAIQNIVIPAGNAALNAARPIVAPLAQRAQDAAASYAYNTAYNFAFREPPRQIQDLSTAIGNLKAEPTNAGHRAAFQALFPAAVDAARTARNKTIIDALKLCPEQNCHLEIDRIIALLENTLTVIEANGDLTPAELDELHQKLEHNLTVSKGLLGFAFRNLVSYATDIVNGQGTGILGQGFEFVMSNPILGILKEVLNHANGLTDPALRTQLTEVIGQIERKDWNALKASLPLLLTCINNARIYVNGIAVPFLGASAPAIEASAPINQFAINVNDNRTDAVPDQPRNLDEIKQEISKLVSYASNYGCIQWVCGSICGARPPSDDFYIQMIRNSRTADNPAAELRRLVFAQIDQSGVWFFTKWFAKLSYMIATPVLSYILGKFAKKLTLDMEEFLTQGQASNFAGLQNHLIDKLTDYLTTLSGAYTRVAENPNPDSRMSIMIQDELGRPQFNGGFATADLYNEVVTKALSDYRLTIDWSQSINDYVSNFAFDPSSPFAFLSPVAQFTLHIFAAIANVLLFIPEWGTNVILNYSAKRIITENELLDKLVKSSLSSLEDRGGYTHSFNLILRDLLQDVWAMVSTPEFDAEPVQESQATSDGRQQQMRVLIKTLFEVLAKKKYDTPQDLRRALQSPGFLDEIRQTFDTQVSEGVIQATIDILLYVFEKKLTSGELRKQTFNLLATVNRTFEEERAPASEGEMLATQQSIADLLNNILNKVIGKAIDAKFDLNKEYQERDLVRVVNEMKASANEFVPDQHAKIQAIRDGLPEDGSALMEVVLTSNREFQSKQITTINRNVTRNNYLDGTVKAELTRQYDQLARSLSSDQAYQQNLDQAIEVQRAVTHDFIQRHNARQAHEHVIFAAGFLNGITGPDGSGEENVLDRYSQYIAEIEGVRATSQGLEIPGLIDFDDLKTRSRDLFITQRQLDLQLEKLSVDSAIFLNFYQRKERALGDPIGFSRLFSYLFNPKSTLLAAIEQLGLSEDQKARLIQTVNEIDNSSQVAELHEKQGEYLRVFTEILDGRRAVLHEQKTQVNDRLAQLRQSIETYIGEKDRAIEGNVAIRDAHLEQSQRELATIQGNVAAFTPAPINRLYAVEDINRLWVVRMLKDYVVKNTKEKVIGVVDLARTPYNWRFALHRVLMVPYVHGEQII